MRHRQSRPICNLSFAGGSHQATWTLSSSNQQERVTQRSRMKANSQRRDGMLPPVQGEVAWVTPEGRKPYWRQTITDLRCHR
ncbi:DUF6920 family protein [Caldimonas taiwanensis]|uniref:DUF6920 family protein n=1 Tax=Caldimonas taiwanensis TaxID=307483 RepID=UPI00352B2E14